MSDKAAPSISEVMTTEVITADRSQALSEVYDLFESRNIHHLPVMDGQKPVGMVSASDVLRLVYDIEDPTDRMMRSMLDHQFNIDDAMTADLDTLTVDATVRDAADRLSLGGGDRRRWAPGWNCHLHRLDSLPARPRLTARSRVGDLLDGGIPRAVPGRP
mgnify:CR=1 FL=1